MLAIVGAITDVWIFVGLLLAHLPARGPLVAISVNRR